MRKTLTVRIADGGELDIETDKVRYIKIVNGATKDAPETAKIAIADRAVPVAVQQSVKDLRGGDFQLVYIGGGVYVPRANIRKVEPLTDADREGLKGKNGVDPAKFHCRVVLMGEASPVWGTKTIEQLNERGMRFLPIGPSTFVPVANIRKIVDLDEKAREAIGAKYGIDASGFKTQVVIEGNDAKLSRLSADELKAKGLDLVPAGTGEFIVRGNLKYFRPFTEQDQEELARKYPDVEAARFQSQAVMASDSTLLIAAPVESLAAAFAAVNVGYDRYVPAANIEPERVEAFSRDDKKGLKDAGYTMERNWRSSVGLVNGRVLSPATAEQIKQRREAALAKSAGAPQLAAE